MPPLLLTSMVQVRVACVWCGTRSKGGLDLGQLALALLLTFFLKFWYLTLEKLFFKLLGYFRFALSPSKGAVCLKNSPSANLQEAEVNSHNTCITLAFWTPSLLICASDRLCSVIKCKSDKLSWIQYGMINCPAEAQKVWTFRMVTFNAQKNSGRCVNHFATKKRVNRFHDKKTCVNCFCNKKSVLKSFLQKKSVH